MSVQTQSLRVSLHKLVLSRANLYLKLLLLAIRREINNV